MKFAIIGDKQMAIGFSLAGVKKSKIVETPEEVKSAITEYIQDAEIGVLIIQDSFAEKARAFIDKLQERKEVYPVIMEISGKSGPIEKEDIMDSLIRRAIGV
ncbi:MAG: hypothetical protein LRZ92_00895 [Methanosarcinaceae archaeon]|jgi:V/A-type H+-transporting ATPase subunit F|nr:hypothetical protein [Methanosarcinaceae archaeon]NKQ39457.1 V-type ATP synthase subunit F [Methanosarcinales archaeon]